MNIPRTARFFLAIFMLCLNSFSYGDVTKKEYGLSLLNGIKYKKDFKHFDYVNPEAPQGGTLKMGYQGAFDSLNPYIVMGNPAPSLHFTHATLFEECEDEPVSSYPYVAESVEISADKKLITFHLNKQARFSDEKQVTADDIVFSFNILRDKGKPLYRRYYADIKQVKALDAYTVVFYNTNPENNEMASILSQLPVLPKHYYEKHAFEETLLDIPPASGPYVVDCVDAPHKIIYKKTKNWWGSTVPSQVGRHNFEFIEYITYRDGVSLFEAFKKGIVHLRTETSSQRWASRYTFDAFKNNHVKKIVLPNSRPKPTTGFFMNMRNPLLQDVNVRKAIWYAFDFNWMNHYIFYNLYNRNDSYFSKSHLSSEGKRSPEILKILELFKDQLPADVFNSDIQQPFYANNNDVRDGLKKAQDLLVQAGYEEVNSDNIRIHNKTKEPLDIRFIYASSSHTRLVTSLKENLERIGINLTLIQLDNNTYANSVENYDYDLIFAGIGQSSTPGNEQRAYFGSKSADAKGGRNYSGIKSEVIDALIEMIIKRSTDKEMIEATKAMDFVLLHGYYMIPAWHFDGHMLALWSFIKGLDKKQPQYPRNFIARCWYQK